MYVKQLLPHFPDFVLPTCATADDVRVEKPILFLAMITAASSEIDSKLNARLIIELRQMIADRVFMKGEKSVELVQALLITTSWSYPPHKYDEAKFYQLIHMAATMALEIGLGKKFGDSAHSTSPAEPDALTFASFGNTLRAIPVRGLPVSSESMEGRRALVSCYIKCYGYD